MNQLNNMNLAKFIGLRPLDRVQINSKAAIAESYAFKRENENRDELPYWYFQRVCKDGRLEVSTPGGFVSYSHPMDICDVIPSEPVIIQSMTREGFKQRLSLPYTERSVPIPASSYVDAYVLLAEKDRFGFVEFLVWFVDDQHNTEDRPWRALQPQHTRSEWQTLARRTRMPVRAKSFSSYSADQGTQKMREYHQYAFRKFVQLTFAKHDAGAKKIQSIGISPLGLREINQL